MNPLTQPRELSVGWELLVQELGKVHGEFTRFVRVKDDGGLVSPATKLEDVEGAGIIRKLDGVRHEISLKFEFCDSKLKVVSLTDEGRAAWMLIPGSNWEDYLHSPTLINLPLGEDPESYSRKRIEPMLCPRRDTRAPGSLLKPFLIVLAVAALGFFAVLFSATSEAPSFTPAEGGAK